MKFAVIAVAVAALAGTLSCAPKSAPSAPAPAAPPPSVTQTCPEPSDGPSIVVSGVEDAHRAFVANASTTLPPACLLVAYAQLPGMLPDSIDAHALDLAAELRRRGTGERDVLASEIVLLARARRYAELSRAYERLSTLDPKPPMPVVRLAMAAARQRGDTATLIRIASRNADRADASPAIRAELNVLRQADALRAAIAEARGLLRQNPKYVAAYPSLIGNYGTLGLADSVGAIVRRALAQGAPRATVATSLDPLVNTMLRHAALYGSVAGWESHVTAAMRVDSVLSTASTKFLVASLVAQAAEPRIAEISALVAGPSWLPRPVGARPAGDRAACPRIAALVASLDVAENRLRSGGAAYAGGGVSQLTASLANERARLATLNEACR